MKNCSQKLVLSIISVLFLAVPVSHSLATITPVPTTEYQQAPSQNGLSSADWIKVNQNQIAIYQQQLPKLQEYLALAESKNGKIPAGWTCGGPGCVPPTENWSKEIQKTKEEIAHINSEIAIRQKNIDLENQAIAERAAEQATQSGDTTAAAEAQEAANQARQAVNQDTSTVRNNLNQELDTLEASPDSAQSHANDDNRCVYKFGIHPWNCVLSFTAAIANLIIKFFGLLLWAASEILDFSIVLSIVKLKYFLEIPGVSTAWRIMRDLANLSFIFILLYIAINVIFDTGAAGKAKSLIVKIIIVALFVNFSGFIVRIIVDASNVIAYEFYDRMSYDQTNDSTYVLNHNLGTALVAKLNLSSQIVSSKSQTGTEQTTTKRLSYMQIIVGTFGSILIIMAASFVLLVASLLFIIRTIVILFLYIFSPLAFVSQVIEVPQFNKFKLWMDTLINQAFYAPAFLIPLYLVFAILGDGLSSLSNSIGGTEGWGDWTLRASGLTLAIMQIVVLVMIAGCIYIAKQLGAIGMAAATSFAGAGTKLGMRPLGDASRKVFGETAGRAGRALANSRAGQYMSQSRVANVARRSWNTGALRDLRTSELGKGVGDFAKNPLIASAERLSKGAAVAGISGFNVLGDTKNERYKDRLALRAGELVKEMKEKTTTPEEQARYLEGITNPDELKAVYSKLSPQERREIEAAARSYSPALANRLSDYRQTLTGKEAQETAIDRFKNATGGRDRMMALASLNQTDFLSVYRGLSDEDKAKLENDATSSGEIDFLSRINTAKIDMAAKAKQKTAIERFKSATSGNDRIAAFSSLSPDDFNDAFSSLDVKERGRLIRDAEIAGVDGFTERINTARTQLRGKAAQENATELFREAGTTQDRVNAVANLNDDNFSGMYNNLTIEERSKLDRAIRDSGNVGLINRANLARNQLGGKSRIDTMVQNIKDAANQAERESAINSLDDQQLAEAYKAMSREDRAQLELNMASNATIGARLSTARASLGATSKAGREAVSLANSAQAVQNFNNQWALGANGNINRNDIRNIHPDMITELAPNQLADVRVAQNLSLEQLKAIKNSTIQPSERAIIKDRIRSDLNIARLQGGLSPDQEILERWIVSPDGDSFA